MSVLIRVFLKSTIKAISSRFTFGYMVGFSGVQRAVCSQLEPGTNKRGVTTSDWTQSRY